MKITIIMPVIILLFFMLFIVNFGLRINVSSPSPKINIKLNYFEKVQKITYFQDFDRILIS